MEKSELEAKNVAELQEIAGTLGVEGLKNLRKGQLIDAILQAANGNSPSGQDAEQEAGAQGEANAGDNGGLATEVRPEAPSQERRQQGGGDGQGRPGGRQRLSREERRRLRDERRQREMEEREREIAEAPVRTGILDVLPEGYGFLRTSGYLPGPTDVYVWLSLIRRFGLRKDDTDTGAIRHPKDNE